MNDFDFKQFAKLLSQFGIMDVPPSQMTKQQIVDLIQSINACNQQPMYYGPDDDVPF